MARKRSLRGQPGHRKDGCPTAGKAGGNTALARKSDVGRSGDPVRELIAGFELLVKRKLAEHDAELVIKINELVDAKLRALADALNGL